jgi:hypothetical protein
MKLKPKTKLAEHFETIEDPRIERTKRILAVICGADSWVEMVSHTVITDQNSTIFDR